MFCRSCGKEMADNAVFCPSCGAPVTGAAPMGSPAAPWQPAQQHVSGAWYLVPLFFGIIGGIIAWAVTKDRDPKRARNLLIFGLVWSLVPILIGLAVFFAAMPSVGPTPYP